MANNFPFGRHFPIAVWVMPLRSEPPDSLNSLQLLWDGTYCCTHGCSQQYWSVPEGKVRVVTEVVTSLSQNPTQTRPWLPAQLLPVSHPLCPRWARSPVWPRPRSVSWRQRPALSSSPPGGDSPLVLLQGPVGGCSSKADWSSPASTRAHQRFQGRKRDLPLQPEPSCTIILHPPEQQTCQPSQQLQTLPMTLFLTASLYLPFIVCFLPYQTPRTALASNYNLLQLSAQ